VDQARLSTEERALIDRLVTTAGRGVLLPALKDGTFWSKMVKTFTAITFQHHVPETLLGSGQFEQMSPLWN